MARILSPYGAADLGIAGKDVLNEHGGASLYQPLDLQIARCRIDLIKLYGSMALVPLVGLSDVIVDLVSTGGMLKAKGLVAVEHISDISSRLVVNQAALKLKRGPIQPVIDAFAAAVEREAS